MRRRELRAGRFVINLSEHRFRKSLPLCVILMFYDALANKYSYVKVTSGPNTEPSSLVLTASDASSSENSENSWRCADERGESSSTYMNIR